MKRAKNQHHRRRQRRRNHAHWCAAAELGDIVLLDIPQTGTMPRQALDLSQAGPIVGYDAQITGTTRYADTAGSDVVVITAGIPRTPGMSRDDLLQTNAKIVGAVATRSSRPARGRRHRGQQTGDAMVQKVLHVTHFAPRRVIGQAGVLDTARFRAFIADELGGQRRGRVGHALVARRYDGAAAELHLRGRIRSSTDSCPAAGRTD